MKKYGIALLVLLVPMFGFAEEENKHERHHVKTGVERLSPNLRGLLSEEMKALQNGMMSVIPAYISGNWGEVEGIANKMKNSYILKQSLTESQVKELHATLPHAFIEKDQEFHYLAGMLGHAAKNKKPELVSFYFSRMNESCVSCHSQFATHKFPALRLEKEVKHTH